MLPDLKYLHVSYGLFLLAILVFIAFASYTPSVDKVHLASASTFTALSTVFFILSPKSQGPKSVSIRNKRNKFFLAGIGIGFTTVLLFLAAL
jgi:hypothetical protein